MDKKIFGLTAFVLVILLASLVNAAGNTNISIMYGWNGTNYIPLLTDASGKLQTDINIATSTGLTPKINNTYDMGTAARIWANIYTRSIRGGSGPLSLFAGENEIITLLANGNVGIGTTSPSQQLNVIGTANLTGGLITPNVTFGDGTIQTSAPTNTNVSVLYGVNGSDSNQPLPVRLTSDGRLDLQVNQANIATATTTSGLSTGANGTDLTLTGNLVASNINVTGTTANSTFSGDVRIFGTLYGGSPLKIAGGLNVSGGIIYNTIVNTVDNVSLNINNTLFVNGSNVGIGTTSPGAMIDVKSSAVSTWIIKGIASDGSTAGGLYEGSAGDGILYAYDAAGNADIRLHPGGDTYFNGSGNVGIGTTSPITGQGRSLQLDGNTDHATLRIDAGNTKDSQLQFSNSETLKWNLYNSNSSSDKLFLDMASINVMSWQQNGNVGIGTTNPTAKFEINSSGTTDASGTSGIWIKKAGTNSLLKITAGGGADTTSVSVIQSSDYANTINYYGGPANAGYNLALNPYGGNVGIGTTVPEATLMVAGNPVMGAKLWGAGNWSQIGLQSWSPGNLNNGASTGGAGFHTDSAPVGSYVMLDTGAATHFDGVAVFSGGITQPINAVWDVQSSNDNSTWTTMYTGLDLRYNFGKWIEVRWNVVNDNSTRRYWRLYKTNNAGGGNYVYELQFFQGTTPQGPVYQAYNGNVGIGDTNPSYKLTVYGDVASNYIARFHNDGNNANRFGIAIASGTDDNSGTNYLVHWEDGDYTDIGYVSSSGGTVTYGAFTANHDVSIPDEYNKKGYPYGTLLCIVSIHINETQPRKILYDTEACKESYAKNVIGTYAGKYEQEKNLHQVYVLGDGHILVNGESGNIRVGDAITTSSQTGIGMKATKSGVVIGIAQENYNFAGNETKLLAVQYGVRNYVPENELENLKTENAQLKARIASLEAKIK